MNCEWVKENVILYVYDELADDSRIEMEQHAEHCPACAQEITAARGFHQEMSSRPQLEVSPNFLAASRMRLSEALETAEQSQWRKWIVDPSRVAAADAFLPRFSFGHLDPRLRGGHADRLADLGNNSGGRAAVRSLMTLLPARIMKRISPAFIPSLRSMAPTMLRSRTTSWFLPLPRATSTIPAFSSCCCWPRVTRRTPVCASIR